MRAGVLAVSVAVALALAPSALAQGGGLLVTRVCGKEGCVKLDTFLYLIRPDGPELRPSAPPPFSEYFVLEPSNYDSPGQTEQLQDRKSVV